MLSVYLEGPDPDILWKRSILNLTGCPPDTASKLVELQVPILFVCLSSSVLVSCYKVFTGFLFLSASVTSYFFWSEREEERDSES